MERRSTERLLIGFDKCWPGKLLPQTFTLKRTPFEIGKNFENFHSKYVGLIIKLVVFKS